MKKSRWFIFGLAAAVLLTACGGSDYNGDDYDDYDAYESLDLAAALFPTPAPTTRPEGDEDEDDGIPDGFFGVHSLVFDQTPWVEIEVETPISMSLSAPFGRSMVVDGSGNLWAFGQNNHGQFGDGTMDNSHVPVLVMEGVLGVSAGPHLTLAVMNDGTMLHWGNPNPDPWGFAPMGAIPRQPQKLMENVAWANADAANMRAITSEGEGFVWGFERFGTQYMRGHSFNGRAILEEGRTANFMALPLAPASFFYGARAFAESLQNSFVIRDDFGLYVWGNELNTMGIGEPFQQTFRGYISQEAMLRGDYVEWHSYSIILHEGTEDEIWLTRGSDNLIRLLDDVVMVSAGSHHTLALDSHGQLWAWGSNEHGQLGDGTNQNAFEPILIKENIAYISAGTHHSIAITNGGTMYTWGNGQNGRLGNGASSNTNTPTPIMQGVSIAQAGLSHNLAVTTNGFLYAWGSNTQGQLGNGTTTSSNVPIRIMGNMNP